MDELFWVRVVAYSVLPLLLASGHILLDGRTRTAPRRIEIFMMYLLAISVGASGLGGAFGHLFLSDLVADGVGWPTGSPFQLEMGFANLLVGVLGLAAVSRRDGFRTATVLATTILGAGATLVHLWDIAATGNLAAGNTVQNVANLLDPVLLVCLARFAARTVDADAGSPAFLRWHRRQQPVVAMAAVGVGVGFGLSFAVGALLVGTVLGALIGVSVGRLAAQRAPEGFPEPQSRTLSPRRITSRAG